ncbi:MAG: 4-hydroxy-3-methylbut-2-enyl diphosphate reductase [Armatimonadota bacterium]|nr:4-hydroxy-3-methylbut-2-enyl diphosphate reductase [Armatimonadota bacterium]
MKVIVAEHAGFCFGVKRALDMVLKAADGGRPLYTLGPLIHNPQVVEKLRAAGVEVVQDIKNIKEGWIVMPSHGVPKEVTNAAREAGLRVIDVTCPFVAKVHKRAAELARAGFQVAVVGDAGHSEVKGILSAAGDDAATVSSPEEAAATEWSDRVGIVAQTTQVEDRFRRIVETISANVKDAVAFDTICYATRDRQNAVLELAPQVQAIVVVGGRNSANTNRLREICESTGLPTHHIETADEIQPDWFTSMDIVGLTAGASTPNWIIEEVKRKLESG